MTFVDLLFDEFGAEMAARGLTRQMWLDFVRNVWARDLKEIHISENERKQFIERYLHGLSVELSSWSLNEALKICKMAK